MQPFKFLQCGDLHLGAPFHYVEVPGSQVAQAVAEATYQSLANIVELAIAESVNFVVITGDIYNSEDHNLEAQIRFVRAMEALEEAQIPVYMIQGNHDPAESWRAQLTLPDNVHLFSYEPDGLLAERYPLMVDGHEVGGVYGISIGHGNEQVNMANYYTPRETDEFSLALMHGTVGSSTEHVVTGPCSLTDLIDRGMDYWALGHIHKRQVLNESPYIVYAGNTQGLHKKEVGPKGCYIVEVASNGQCQLHFHETAALRFETAFVSIADLAKESDIVEAVRQHMDSLRTQTTQPVLLNVVLEGAGDLHSVCGRPEARQVWLQDLQGQEVGRQVFIMPYRMDDETLPVLDLASRRGLGDMVSDYLAAYDHTAANAESLRQIVKERPEFKRLGLYSDFLTDDMLMRAWARAESEGVTKLLGDDDEH
ncbi:MAG: DNA repair exonuclease [Veillonella sp.]|nr:DNA repair exonuclease [Veillonella sp.]